MSSTLMKLAKLYKEIREAFDFQNVESIEIKKINKFRYESIDGKLEVNFKDAAEIALLPDFLDNVTAVYNVEYKVNNRDDQAYKTDYREFIGILKGVKIAIEDFIDAVHPHVLLIASSNRTGKFGSDPSKDKLYKYALLKNLPNGYNADFDVQLFADIELDGIRMYKKTIRETKLAPQFRNR